MHSLGKRADCKRSREFESPPLRIARFPPGLFYLTREREATPADVPTIARIWNEGIADRIATLDEDPKTEADVDAWFADHDARYAVTVALDADGHVVGWASLNRYSDRRAYAGVADLSIYIARESRGQGIGKQLLRALEVRAKQNEFHKIVLFALARNDAETAL